MTKDDLTHGMPEGIVLWHEPMESVDGDGKWIIKHEKSGVTTQGDSQLHALLMLVDALAGYRNEDVDLMDLAEDVFVMDKSDKEFLDGLENSSPDKD